MRSQQRKRHRSLSDSFAEMLAGSIQGLQNAWSGVMLRLFARLKIKGQWAVMAGLVFLMAGLNIYLLTDALSGKRNYLNAKVKISIPVMPPAAPKQSANHLLQVDISNRIRNFKMQMDSLAASPGGKAKQDSMLRSRKGLLDSINALTKIYQQLNNH